MLDLLSAAISPASVAPQTTATLGRVADSAAVPVGHVTAQEAVDGLSKAGWVISDRKLRHLAVRLLSAMPDPAENADRWRWLLASRGPAQRMWAHPGVLQRLKTDPRIAIGGAEAAATVGEGLSRTEKLDLYVGAPELKHIVSDYHLRPDANGQIVVHVVPESVPPDLAPRPGEPVPVAAAAADLLEEDDPRANHAALRQLGVMCNALVHSHPTSPSTKYQEAASSSALDRKS